MEATAIVDALHSKLAYLPGGRDLDERPLIIIDANVSPQLINDHLDKILKYISSIFSADTRRTGVCIIIDAQRTTWRNIRSVLNHIIETLRTESTKIIVLRQEVFWDKQKVENCARLKYNYRPVYLPISRLHKYVSRSHLPEYLGGTWTYNHKSWIDNRIKVEGFVKLAENAIMNLESLRHRLNNARQSIEKNSIFLDLSEPYEITKEITHQTVNTGCTLIELLEKQHTNTHKHLITVPQDIIDTKDRINRLLQIIQGKLSIVQEAWAAINKKHENIKEVMKMEDGMTQVTNWILGTGEMLLNTHYIVGYDVPSAEDLRRDHESLELQCREPYGHYAELLHKLNMLSKNGIQLSRDLVSQKDFMDFVCRSFAKRVEKRRNILITSARFFRLVSEYFRETSRIYESLVMCIDMESLENPQETLDKLQCSQINTDKLEKDLMKEGEKLSDLLSMPVKDALGRDLSVNYEEDIANVREILDMTVARRQLYKDSVELQRLTLERVTYIRNYETNALQAIEWLEQLYKIMIMFHTHVGSNINEIQIQKQAHQCFQDTAKGTFEFGYQLINAASVLRQSCKLSEQYNTELSFNILEIWKKLYSVSQEQLTRLRVCAVFHRDVDQHYEQLKELTKNFMTMVMEEENHKKPLHLKQTLVARENILVEVGRTMRLGRLLKTRLREPLCSDCSDEFSNINKIAIDAICDKLSEVTLLAEQLDTTLCGLKYAMESDQIKKLLESSANKEMVDSNNNSTIAKNLSDSSKSDDDFLTASDCTGTPPSRASSFHTASEDEPSNAPWWEIEPSPSPDNEIEPLIKRAEVEKMNKEFCDTLNDQSDQFDSKTRGNYFRGHRTSDLSVPESSTLFSFRFPCQVSEQSPVLSEDRVPAIQLDTSLTTPSITDGLRCSKRIIKQALTGAF